MIHDSCSLQEKDQGETKTTCFDSIGSLWNKDLYYMRIARIAGLSIVEWASMQLSIRTISLTKKAVKHWNWCQFVALLLAMAGSRIFHLYFSILSNCLPWNMWQSFIVRATTSSPTGWNADLKGNNQEWQGVMLEIGWRTANYNEEHRGKWNWWYKNDEHISKKEMPVSDKKTSWDGKCNVRRFFFWQVHPTEKHRFAPNTHKPIATRSDVNPLQSWRYLRG